VICALAVVLDLEQICVETKHRGVQPNLPGEVSEVDYPPAETYVEANSIPTRPCCSRLQCSERHENHCMCR